MHAKNFMKWKVKGSVEDQENKTNCWFILGRSMLNHAVWLTGDVRRQMGSHKNKLLINFHHKLLLNRCFNKQWILTPVEKGFCQHAQRGSGSSLLVSTVRLGLGSSTMKNTSCRLIINVFLLDWYVLIYVWPHSCLWIVNPVFRDFCLTLTSILFKVPYQRYLKTLKLNKTTTTSTT